MNNNNNSSSAIFVEFPSEGDEDGGLSLRVDALVGFIDDYDEPNSRCLAITPFPTLIGLDCPRKEAVSRVKRAVHKAENPDLYPSEEGKTLGYSLLGRLSALAYGTVELPISTRGQTDIWTSTRNLTDIWYHDYRPVHKPESYVTLAAAFLSRISERYQTQARIRVIVSAWIAEYPELEPVTEVLDKHPDYLQLPPE